MPEETSFMEAVAEVSRIIQFENWLRFYFIREEGETLTLELPQEAMDRIKEKYEILAPLAEDMNHMQLDYETSVKTVSTFIVRTLDGKKYRTGLVPSVFDSKEFQMESHLFNCWVQGHEEQLDSCFMEFDRWNELFEEWKQSDEVQKWFAEVRQGGGDEAADPTQ